jgi:NAD(P)-dependent dehydrogenase (short-subunit alcohol dehydrogenase family)
MLQAAFDHFASKFEKIDVSVSNACHLSDIAAIDDSDDED